MANNNTDKIDSIVDPQVLKQLSDLDVALDKSYNQMGKMLNETLKVEKSLGSISTKYQDLVDAITKYESIQRRSNTTQSEQDRILRQQEILRQRITSAYSQESMELERLRQLNQDITRTRRNLVREQNSQTGSTQQLRAQLNQLVQSYDAMRASTRNSPIGQQMRTDIRRLTQEITDLETSTGRTGRNVGNYLTRVGAAVGVFAGNMMTKAIEGLKQLTAKAIEFVKAGVEMAGKAEGISRAFDKLSTPDLLKNLRTETKGLVSDLALMQTAVKANTFGIPLENLGKMLKFAQQRAQETGQSVDYLVESIINGIGRKSPLILDNLGISHARLSEEVKKSGDFTSAAIKIVNEELEKQGDLALTAADKAQQSSVKWENAQLAVGKRFSWLGGLWDTISGGIADKITDLAGQTESLNKEYNDQLDKVAKLNIETVPLIKKYEDLSQKVKLNKDQTEALNPEQKELLGLIDQISSAIPGAVTEWDNHGRAIKLNTQAAWDYIEVQKEILKYTNRDLIAEQAEQAKKAEQAVKNLQKKLEQGGQMKSLGFGEGSTTEFVEFTAEERGKLEEEVSKWIAIQNKANNVVETLDGTSLERRLKNRQEELKKRDEFNSMNQKQLDAWIKDEKNAASVYLSIAKQVYGQRFALVVDPKPDPKAETEKKKLAEAEKKAMQDIAELKSKKIIDANKKVLDDDKQSYENRLMYLDDFVVSQKESLELSRKHQLDVEKLTKSQIELINLKVNADLIKIDEEASKIRLEIQKDNAEKLLKNQAILLEKRNAEIEAAERQRLLSLSKQHSQGLINQEEYEQGKVDIARDTSKKIFDTEIDSLDKSLNIEGLTAGQKEDITKKLGEARIDYEKYVNETIISDEEKAADRRIEIEKQLADKRKELLEGSLDFISTLFSAYTDKQIAKLENQSKVNSEYYDEEQSKVERLAEAGAITAEQADARKAYIAEQEKEREEELEAKKKEILNRQAKYEKAIAVARIGMDTASALMRLWVSPGFPAAIPLSATVATLGAVQLATVLASPLPEYAQGTDFHKGGLAIVGDGGKHEMIITPDNKIYQSPNVDTLVDLPIGTKVLPDYAKALEKTPSHNIGLLKDEKTIIIQENKRQISLAETNNVLLGKTVKEVSKLGKIQRFNNTIGSIGSGLK